jgi:hypothetical protein
LDGAARFQRFDAPRTGGGRQADGFGEFHDRQPAIPLQRGKYPCVKPIKLHVLAPQWFNISDYR